MCGICAAVSPTPLRLESLVHQLMLINHRGHEAVGIGTISLDGALNRFVGLGPAREACHVDQQPFRIFSEKFAGQSPHVFVGHTRYSTVGASTLDNAQPLLMENPYFGPFFLVHNGQVPMHKRLRRELEDSGQRFVTESDSEVLAAMIAHSNSPTLPEAVAELMQKVPGIYSIVVLGRRHMVAARDQYGVWPLWWAKLLNGTIVIASEEPGVNHAQKTAEIAPGTMLAADIGTQAYRIQAVCKSTPHRCWLDVVYLNRPDEGLGDQTTGDARFALGKRLALEAPAKADLVVGVPDSGLDAAAGFAETSGIPLVQRSLVRNRFAPGRSFILPGQSLRDETIHNKHRASYRKVRGKRVVIVDDSVMRANTARIITALMREAGAMEIHWRIAAPLVRYPCFYGIDIPTHEELAAYLGSEAEIAAHVGAQSLQYLSPASMLAVMNQFHSGWCMACVTGQYPISLP